MAGTSIEFEEMLRRLADDAPGETVEGAWGVAARAWVAAIDLRCAGCGYPLVGVPEPRCPECGRVVRLDDLRDVLSRPEPAAGPDTRPLWRAVRRMGTAWSWCLQAAVFAALLLGAAAAGGGPVVIPLLGALAGLVLLVACAYLQIVVRSIVLDHRRVMRRPPPREELAPDRLFWRVRAVVGTFSAACLALGVVLLVTG